MNSSARPITEEDLHAYVDGFLRLRAPHCR